jgi:hypothetical protein
MEHELVFVLDAGACHQQPTTVIDLTPMAADGGDAVVSGKAGAMSAGPVNLVSSRPGGGSTPLRPIEPWIANIIQTIGDALPVLFHITVHEAAPRLRGSPLATTPPTAASPEPRQHIDPVGTILMSCCTWPPQGRFCSATPSQCRCTHRLRNPAT